MVLGLGIDLVEHSRMVRELARGDWRARDGIFTRNEINRCAGKGAAERYAAVFAAKEATLKALNIPVADLGIFREIEIVGSCVVLHRRARARAEELGAGRVRLAIARTSEYAMASVILEDSKGEANEP